MQLCLEKNMHKALKLFVLLKAQQEMLYASNRMDSRLPPLTAIAATEICSPSLKSALPPSLCQLILSQPEITHPVDQQS